jgi:hypothetical protein
MKRTGWVPFVTTHNAITARVCAISMSLLRPLQRAARQGR